jgi:hypothetical protein
MNNIQRTQKLHDAINYCIKSLGKNIGITPIGCLLLEYEHKVGHIIDWENFQWWKDLLDTSLTWTFSFGCGYDGKMKIDCKFPTKPIDPKAYGDRTLNDDAYELGKSFRQQYWNVLC